MRLIVQLRDQYFTDLARENIADNDVNLRSWLWFTCPANLRVQVRQAIELLKPERPAGNAKHELYAQLTDEERAELESKQLRRINWESANYGWIKCICKNTVKFDNVELYGLCPACNALYARLADGNAQLMTDQMISAVMAAMGRKRFGNRLSRAESAAQIERLEHGGWSSQQIADALGVTTMAVSRYRTGDRLAPTALAELPNTPPAK